MRDDLQSKLKIKIKHDDPIMDWMLPWAAGLITRYAKRESGKSAYEEIRGKNTVTAIAAFGERILYMPKLNDKQQPRFSSGVFLGLQRRSNEAIVGTENGVFKARTIRRLAPDAKWSAEYVRSMVGVPHEPVPGRPGENITMGTAADGERTEREKELTEPANIPTNLPQDPPTTRKMYIRKADVEKYGPTEGCNGCTGALTGETVGRWPNVRTIPHNNACRQRMKQMMENDEEGKSRLKSDAVRQERQEIIRKAASTQAAGSRPEEVINNKVQEPKNDLQQDPKEDKVEDEKMEEPVTPVKPDRKRNDDGGDIDVTPREASQPQGST